MEYQKTEEMEMWNNGKPKDCVNGEMGNNIRFNISPPITPESQFPITTIR